MREIISVHIGKAGINTGLKTWEIIESNNSAINKTGNKNIETWRMYDIANQTSPKPRAIFVDTDEESFENISTSRLAPRIPKENLVHKPHEQEKIALRSSKESLDLIDTLNEAIRREAEKCEQLGGILIYHSAGGGVGCGVTRELLKRLPSSFNKVPKMCFPIFSCSKLSGNILETYNNLLTIDSLIEQGDANILFDNVSVRRMRKRHLKSFSYDLSLINSVISFNISNLLIGLRADSNFLYSIEEFSSSFVPYPRINLLTSSMSNTIPLDSDDSVLNRSLYEMASEPFENENQLFNINHRRGKLMASSMYFHGDKIVPKEICPVICKIKTNREIKYVDWSPIGFKCGLNYNRPFYEEELENNFDFKIRNNLINCIHNSTDMGHTIKKVNQDFDTLWSRRSFLQSYFDEGWEEGEMVQALENVAGLEMDYKECSTESEGEGD